MLVVIPYCLQDLELQRINLEWMAKLGKQPFTCLLSTEDGVEDLTELASKAFERVQLFRYSPYEGEKAWPRPQNYAWQQTARHMYENGKQPWFWLESDACPLTKDWVRKLKEGHEAGGKPFSGCVVEFNPRYSAGCMVYPWDVMERCTEAMLCRASPWDMVLSQFVLPEVYNMKHLIDHRRAPSQIFEHPEDLKVINRGAVVFHKCKTGALQTLLSGKKLPPKQVSTATSFYHSGNLGDIIYSLYAIKAHGGGDLIIGPDQTDTQLCSNPVGPSTFEMLRPLLQVQPYLKSVRYAEKRPADALNLNCFRNYWLNTIIRARSKADSLCKMHFYLLSILDRYKDDEDWLTVPEPIKSDRIIVSRSWRHRNWDFPWGEAVKRFGKRLMFVGLEKEYHIFQMCWMADIEWRPVSNFLELARVIAGARGLIGNQSFCMSLAIGMGQSVLQEVFLDAPDCLFKRKNFKTKLEDFKA